MNALLAAWIAAATLAQADGELTFSQCLDMARKYHPRLESATHGIRVSEAKVGQAWAGSLPVVEVSVGYARATSNFASIPGLLPDPWLSDPAFAGTESDRSYSSLAGIIGIHHVLFDFGRTSGSIEAGQRDVDVSSSLLQQVKTELAYELMSAYLQCASAQEIVTVRERAIEQRGQHLERAKSQFNAGKRPKTDVTKAEVDVANARLALLEAQSEMKVGWLGLQQAMGFPKDPLPNRVAPLELPPLVSSLNVDEAVGEAFGRRTEMTTVRLRILNARAMESVARSGYYPTLEAQAQYDWRGQSFPLVHNWSFGFMLTFPVFNGFLTGYRLDEAQARIESLKAQSETVTQIIRVEVEQAAANLVDAAERVRVADVVVTHATEHRSLTQTRYDAGAGTYVELNEAQMEFNAAEIQKIQARREYAKAKARWDRSLGLLSL